jgi:curved DNA-binding protein CbpA
MESRDAYQILNVTSDADPDVIRAAYRVLARKLHPDGRATPLNPVAETRMADLNWAYAQIRDATARARYEVERREAPPRAAPPPTSTDPRTHGVSPPPAEHDPTLAVLDFGRYAGWKLHDVAKRDIDYITWLHRHASAAHFRPAIDRLLRERATKAGPARAR